MALRLLLLGLSLIASASGINLGTYNIRYDNSGDPPNGNAWPQRAPVIAQMIRFHDFDIVGTQEGLPHQIKDLAALLPDHSYTGCGRDDGKEAGEFVAIYYRKDKFKLLDSGHFWFSQTPKIAGKGWDALLPRICAWGKFEDVVSHKTLFFFSVHLDHRGAEARKNSAALAIQMIQKIAGDQPVVLSGDFNFDQTSEGYTLLHTAGDLLRDAYEISPIRLAPNGTANSFDPAKFTERRIDHIFVSRHFTVSRYGILTDTYRTPKPVAPVAQTAEVKSQEYDIRLPSDHFPVLIEAGY